MLYIYYIIWLYALTRLHHKICFNYRLYNMQCGFQMTPQSMSIRLYIFTFVMCVQLLQCVFSNAALKRLPIWIQNYIDCICLPFLHCGFWNAALNCMHLWMHNYIGYICLTFLHCAFSNDSSNYLLNRCKIKLVAFVWFFFTVHFQMYHHIA